MSIVGAFDAHRRQLTSEYLDTGSGELKPGPGGPGQRQHLAMPGKGEFGPYRCLSHAPGRA